MINSFILQCILRLQLPLLIRLDIHMVSIFSNRKRVNKSLTQNKLTEATCADEFI